jgi:hypothetical protein
VQAVEIFVLDSKGEETLCFRGHGMGRATTKPWLKPGLEFRLRDATTGALLATTLFQPEPESTAQPPRVGSTP